MQSYIIIGIFGLLILALMVIFLVLRKREPCEAYEEMDGHDFEYFCADLLSRGGFSEVEVTKGSGDYGIDILAEKDGVTYAIQCKRYTTPAVEAAKKLKILLWDGGYLAEMVKEEKRKIIGRRKKRYV